MPISNSNTTPASCSYSSKNEEEEEKDNKYRKRTTNPIQSKTQEVERKLNEFQLKSRNKCSFTCNDLCESFKKEKTSITFQISLLSLME